MVTFFDCAWYPSLLAITVNGLLADGAQSAYLPSLPVFEREREVLARGLDLGALHGLVFPLQSVP